MKLGDKVLYKNNINVTIIGMYKGYIGMVEYLIGCNTEEATPVEFISNVKSSRILFKRSTQYICRKLSRI